MSDKKKTAPVERRLPNSRLKEVSRTVGKVLYQATLEDGTEKKDLLNPNFYSLVASRFSQSGFLPEIEAIPDDESFYFKGIILSHGNTHAVVKEIIFVDFSEGKKKQKDDVKNANESGDESPDDSIVEDQGYKVQKQGSTWSVVAPDGNIVKSDLKTKSLAQRELEEHLVVLSL